MGLFDFFKKKKDEEEEQNNCDVSAAGAVTESDEEQDVTAVSPEEEPSTGESDADAEDENTQVLYFKDATATFYSFTAEPEVIEL